MDERGESAGSAAPPPPEMIVFERTVRRFDASVFAKEELPPLTEGATPAPAPAAAAAPPPIPAAAPEASSPAAPPPGPLDAGGGVIFERKAPKRGASVFAMPPEELEREMGLQGDTAFSRSLPPAPGPAPAPALGPSPFVTPAPPEVRSASKLGGADTATEGGTPHFLSSLGALGSAGTAGGGGGGGPDPERTSNVMSEIARKLRESRKDPGKASLFDKGGAAATALAAIASILGSAVLAAVLAPSEVIFTRSENGTYPHAFCSNGAYAATCDRLRIMYSLCCIATLIFDLLCLLSTVVIAIGLNSYLTVAYSFFMGSILTQTLALAAAAWLAFPFAAAVGSSAMLAVFLVASAFFVLPGIALAWHFRFGLNKTLTLEKAPPGGPAPAASGLRDIFSAAKLGRAAPAQAKVIEGSTVLHWAAYHGGRRARLLLSVLLAAGESVDIPAQGADAGGWTPLHIAAYRGNVAIVRQLVGAGANVELTDAAHARTALHFSALKGHVGVVLELLKAGADPMQLDVVGNTPLELARLAGHDGVVSAMRRFQRDKLNAELLTSVKWRKAGRVRQLLAAGADADAADARGTSALTWAANRGFDAGVEDLLAKGAPVNSANAHGSTPLIEAAMAGHAATARLLLEHGADARAAFCGTGETAITVAARRGHFEVVETLLDEARRADPLEKEPSPVTRREVDEAALNRHGAVLRLLLGHRPQAMTLLQAAACIGSVPAVKLYLEKGELARERGAEVTALHYAAQEGHAEVAACLLEGGAARDARDGEGRAPLHWAALEGHVGAARALVGAGAALEIRDDEGLTPLLLAAAAGGAEVVEVLLRAGADAGARDAAGHSPLHLAVLHRQQPVVEALLAHNADFTSVDSDNQTPLDSARATGNAAAAERLARALTRPGQRRRPLPV